MGFLYENKEKSNQFFVAYKNSNFNKKMDINYSYNKPSIWLLCWNEFLMFFFLKL